MCGTFFEVTWDESGNVWHELGITREFVTYMLEVLQEYIWNMRHILGIC